jgi:hypothetical protein
VPFLILSAVFLEYVNLSAVSDFDLFSLNVSAVLIPGAVFLCVCVSFLNFGCVCYVCADACQCVVMPAC